MKKLFLILVLFGAICTGCTDHPRIYKSKTEWMYTDDIYRIVELDSIHYIMLVNYNKSGRIVQPVIFNKETGESVKIDTNIE